MEYKEFLLLFKPDLQYIPIMSYVFNTINFQGYFNGNIINTS